MYYRYGDFVYGVTPSRASVFSLEDYCIGMVVETKNGAAESILLLDSRYLDGTHEVLKSEVYTREVRRIRSNKDLYKHSLFKTKYNMYVMNRHKANQHGFAPLYPTEEGFQLMNAHTKLLLEENGLRMTQPNFIDYPTFRQLFLIGDFLKPTPIPLQPL